ncbi:hypothetical protein PILCRDRAFT_821898 [Piloderma croceum F 1598]|uniref:Uncharacterized protein n=1 Tax=Piloderma croceum (strain F 1598) TaxID=765440 RepID=A0A0C3FMQ2_PILCF|nr:hypothetical protein PILCRDRAFT_821898 [Piloderma croceum F 1598]
MCVGFWSLEHPDYALILCTNRDEFLSRPTMAAEFHSFGHEAEKASILSGRDLRAGGTWLGMNLSGRVALLTNITEPPSEMNLSRGHLISSYLLADPTRSLSDELRTFGQMGVFAGFNLLLLSPLLRESHALSFDAALVTNHGAGGVIQSRPLSPGERLVGGMTNGVDGQGGQEWPKVQHGIRSLNEYLATVSSDTKEAELTERLFELLTWRSPDPIRQRSEFKETILIDPVSIAPNGGPSQAYGTRLSTVILIKRDGQALFIERDILQTNEDGKLARTDTPSERVYRFQLSVDDQVNMH